MMKRARVAEAGYSLPRRSISLSRARAILERCGVLESLLDCTFSGGSGKSAENLSGCKVKYLGNATVRNTASGGYSATQPNISA